jgi:hypothetical protein
VFGASRLLVSSPPKPAVGTETPPRSVTEFIVLPPPATAERGPIASAEGASALTAPGGAEDSLQRFSFVAPAASTSEPVALDDAGMSVSAASAPPLVPPPLASPAPSPPTAPPVACGTTTCAPDEVCCNRTCGICAAPGQACTRQQCGSASYPTSASCGDSTCNAGDVCCNPSCGICAPPGAACSQTRCDDGPTLPFSQACGMNTCNVDSVCCDASCGLCAPVAECAGLHC